MRLTINAQDKRPLHQQVMDGVKAQIASGKLREGMVLPSVRQAAEELGVNLNTIAVAYRKLQAEGLVWVRHGMGAVVHSRRVAYAPAEELRRLLRNALTQMVLSGREKREIVALVKRELIAAGLMGRKRRGGY